MRIIIVGGTGHIGTYLVPRLVLAGHEVSIVARNSRPQYVEPDRIWNSVQWIAADRRAEEKAGTWSKRMAAIEADVVIDLLAFTSEENHLMVEAFRGRIDHFLHIGSIWAYGPTRQAPYEEHFSRRPTTGYGIGKAQIESDLLTACRRDGFPATIVHPGHISGRYWLPIDPQGSRDGVGIYEKLARGDTVNLPDLGLAMLHHVHSDDIAQIIQRSIDNPKASVGESFSAVADYALSLLGCCHYVSSFFGRKPKLSFVPLDELRTVVGDASFEIIESHVCHSPCSSNAKARRLLGFASRYTTEEIYAESIEYLLETGELAI